MPHIVSIILFYVATILMFLVLLALLKLDAKAKERKKCMMNHPAGKLVPIEHSHFGVTEENLRKMYVGGYTYKSKADRPRRRLIDIWKETRKAYIQTALNFWGL